MLAAGWLALTPDTAADAESTPDIAMLWQEPADLESRDLYYGPGGPSLLPAPKSTFTLVKEDRTGYSAGYDVRDAGGHEWSVKLGPEVQPEIAASRILWAIGYHQPATYLVFDWTMTDGSGKTLVPGPARFRPEPPDEKVVGDWSWSENPFAGTPQLRGLIVANLMLNNWDWKTSNNKIYDVSNGAGTTRRYVVRDLGASLGKTSSPKLLRMFGWRGAQGTRNDIDGFEQQGFIRAVHGNTIDFDYKGIYGSLLKTVTPADVVWTSRLMARISDTQWDNAFRAAGYPDDDRRRYIAKLKAKIAEGLKVGPA